MREGGRSRTTDKSYEGGSIEKIENVTGYAEYVNQSNWDSQPRREYINNLHHILVLNLQEKKLFRCLEQQKKL